jgi:hypothetical protein
VIKSFFIIVLAIALAAAAFVTRPTEQSARAFLVGGAQPTAEPPKTLSVAVKDTLVKTVEQGVQGPAGLPSGYEFKDRILWVEVVKDGQTIYTGVLSHWIKHEPTTPGKKETTVVAGK